VTGGVSVAIAAYQAERYVHDAIASVLDQDPAPDEVVVVDDGSTDGTADVVAGFGAQVHLVRARHEGYVVALNRAIARCRGALLAFQDADDLWVPGRLARQIAALDADPALDAASGSVEMFVSPDVPAERVHRYRIPPPMPSYQFSSLLIRRASFDRVGPIDPEAGTGATFDWVSRARAAGIRTAMLPDLLVRRRVHGSNMSRRDAAARDRGLLRALRDHRRRVAGPGT
jgi:glycosyltransferase involved in cell wall biosynthesis